MTKVLFITFAVFITVVLNWKTVKFFSRIIAMGKFKEYIKFTWIVILNDIVEFIELKYFRECNARDILVPCTPGVEEKKHTTNEKLDILNNRLMALEDDDVSDEFWEVTKGYCEVLERDTQLSLERIKEAKKALRMYRTQKGRYR